MELKLLYGTTEQLPSDVVNGRLLFVTNTGEIYFEINDTRIKLYQSAIADAKAAGTTAQTNLTALENKIGTPDTGKTIVEMIKAVEAGDSSLSDKVTAVEAAIATLNGSGDGSVSKAVSEAVASIVAGAGEDFDTLKEIADWIASDTTGSAQMANSISALKAAVGENEDGDLISVSSSISTALNALSTEDSEQDGYYVSEVSQANGKITIKRKAIPQVEWGTFADAANS